MLDERKIKVLYAIINSHLISAEPIGSRTISKDYDLGVSAATIRNEMSDLEEKGYLNKPHSSAGRIPSDKAYRLYVDEIIKIKKPTSIKKNEDEIRRKLYEESKEVEELIENAAKMLTKITSYTSVVMSPQLNKSKLEHIQLLKISDDRILMIIVDSSGLVKNSIFKYDNSLEEDQLIVLSNFLNEKFRGLTIEEILTKVDRDKITEDKQLSKILNIVLPELVVFLKDIREIDIYSEGITKILNFPEYNDLEKAKSFISFIENKDLMIDLMSRDTMKEDVQIIIGDENSHESIKDCSVITANYRLGEKIIGKVGIVGPTRMDYINLINVLTNFSKDVSEVLNIFLG